MLSIISGVAGAFGKRMYLYIVEAMVVNLFYDDLFTLHFKTDATGRKPITQTKKPQ